MSHASHLAFLFAALFSLVTWSAPATGGTEACLVSLPRLTSGTLDEGRLSPFERQALRYLFERTRGGQELGDFLSEILERKIPPRGAAPRSPLRALKEALTRKKLGRKKYENVLKRLATILEQYKLTLSHYGISTGGSITSDPAKRAVLNMLAESYLDLSVSLIQNRPPSLSVAPMKAFLPESSGRAMNSLPWESAARAQVASAKRLQEELGSGVPEEAPSSIARRSGITGLVQTTSFKNLLEMAKTGVILPGNKLPPRRANGGTMGNNMAGVFMEAVGLRRSGRNLNDLYSLEVAGDPSPVVLSFDLKLLNQHKFHVTPKWEYGEKTEASAESGDRQGLKEVFETIADGDRVRLTQGSGIDREHNEVVFRSQIPFSALEEIWVAPERRDALIKALVDSGIPPPRGLTWERLVVARKSYP